MARKLLYNSHSESFRSVRRIVILLLIGVFLVPGFSSCSKKVCAAYSKNLDGNIKRKSPKKNRRRQEGLDKKIYKWGP